MICLMGMGIMTPRSKLCMIYLMGMYVYSHFIFSFTITFFAKEEPNCTFIPQFPEVYPPTRFSFQKGPGQRFLQPSGTGTDLSFFALDDLSKPLEEDVYPLVISAETVISPSSSSVHKQVTQAVLERDSDGSFQVKVVKQILWIEGVRYELRELYGSTTQGASSGLEDGGSGKECVICMTEAKDTAVLPCRHLVTKAFITIKFQEKCFFEFALFLRLIVVFMFCLCSACVATVLKN